MNRTAVSLMSRAAGRKRVPLHKQLLPALSCALLACGCSTPGGASGSIKPIDAAATVDYGTVFQTLEGFGAAGAYDAAQLQAFGQTNPTIYDDLFGAPATGRGLGLDIYRIKNTYLQTGDANLAATGAVVAAAKTRNPLLKIELVPWSPPAALKSNGDINNGGTIAPGGGTYDYAAYAAWWGESVANTANGWASVGVVPDYISLQNEPDIATGYESFLLQAQEGSARAGYNLAFDAVYAELYGRLGAAMPKMIGPETVGYSNGPSAWAARGSRDYIDALSAEGKNHIYAYSFHPYGDGGGESAYDNPDNHLAGLRDYAADPRYNDKPLFMTEYVRLNHTPDFDNAVKLAWHIHNFLTEMRVSAYIHWTLFRSSTASTGGMINFDPGDNDYQQRDLYYFFKAYSYFTDPGWRLIAASATVDNLRVTAFRSPAAVNPEEAVIVVLNKSAAPVDLALQVQNFSAAGSQVFRSSAVEHWKDVGSLSPGTPLAIPALSITTIRLVAAP